MPPKKQAPPKKRASLGKIKKTTTTKAQASASKRKPAKVKSKVAAAPKTFEGVFEKVDSTVATIARHLRRIVLAALPDAHEAVAGGSKVQVVLYSQGGPNRVVCGIQPTGGRCLFYLHRIDAADLLEFTLGGQGKHARHVAFTADEQIRDDVLRRAVLLSQQRLP